jgi:hypothetical protein
LKEPERGFVWIGKFYITKTNFRRRTQKQQQQQRGEVCVHCTELPRPTAPPTQLGEAEWGDFCCLPDEELEEISLQRIAQMQAEANSRIE